MWIKPVFWLQYLLFVIVGLNKVNHPHYSPDLAPSNYYLFPNMKKNREDNGTRQMMKSICFGGLFLEPGRYIFINWNSDVKAPLEEECGSQRRLCRRITHVGSCLTIAS